MLYVLIIVELRQVIPAEEYWKIYFTTLFLCEIQDCYITVKKVALKSRKCHKPPMTPRPLRLLKISWMPSTPSSPQSSDLAGRTQRYSPQIPGKESLLSLPASSVALTHGWTPWRVGPCASGASGSRASCSKWVFSLELPQWIVTFGKRHWQVLWVSKHKANYVSQIRKLLRRLPEDDF